MVDFINKLIKFPNLNIEVKPIYILYNTERSQILLCEETKTKYQFCIKVILSEKNDINQLNAIKNEIYLLQKMKNEKFIVQMYDYISLKINNYFYYLILMEYCKYHTLLEYIDKNKILDDSQIYYIIYQIAIGLKALHKNKYYHRDLRPENILLRNRNDKYIEIAICDFGSATNQIYSNEKLKNIQSLNLMNELLLDLDSKTYMIYRAPEEIFLNSKYPITEKVDIFALGVISVMLLLSYIPPKYFNFQLLLHSSTEIRRKIISEINNLCNPCFTELFDSIFSTDPTQRFNIDEVINFLILNQNKIKQVNEDNHKKEKILFNETYHKTLYEFEEQEMNNNQFSIKILTRRILHGKFLNEKGIFEAPDSSYIETIIDMLQKDPSQAIEFYGNLFSTNVFFLNVFSLKFEFDLHYFVFYFNDKKLNKFPNNIEIICPKNINIFEQINNFTNFFNFKNCKKYYNKDEILKDAKINEFILQYINLIKKKIILLEKYPLLISNDNTINTYNQKDLVSQNFIFDIWYLFSLSFKLLTSLSFDYTIISKILEAVSNLLNKELVSLCSILLIQLISLRKKNKNFDFISQFIEKLKNSAKFLIKEDKSDNKIKALLNFISDIKYEENFDINDFLKPESNFRKKFDFIPVKITSYGEDLFNNNDDNEILELNRDLSNLFINNNNKKELLNQNNLEQFNQIFFSKSSFSKNEKNQDLNTITLNQSDFSSTLLQSNLSNISFSTNINVKNKSFTQNNIQNLIPKDISYFLFSLFSTPLYHFLIQPYDIKTIRLIGLGATNEVYLGKYKGSEVAIKKIKVKDINDNFYKEYQNELSILTSIRHSNLIIFLGTMLEENNLCLITEYCEGGTLYDLLYKKKNIEIPWNLKLKFLIDISKAIFFLHTNEPKIIHHDLKSLNILLSSDILENNSNEHVAIKISDFGLCQMLSKDSKNPNLKGIGSVQWMAPETLQSNTLDNINEKVDVYSFGIIIWEIYARTQPYKNMNISQVINYVCNENGRPNCDLIKKEEMPKGLFELMEKCWDKNPNSRPDFEEILGILNDIKSLGE